MKGDAVFGIEKWVDMLEEIAPLYANHFAETETEYIAAEYEPDYSVGLQGQESGRFVVFTLRVAGELAGYLQYHVYRWQHSATVLTAREDAFYIAPEHRGKKYASPFVDYAEAALKKLGCRYVGMTSKGPIGAPDIGPFLESRDYRHVANYFVKEL